MIDLHTHTLFSDGELLPAELIRRAEEIGYEAIALTDHADSSNLDWIVPRIVRVCRDLNRYRKIRALPGVGPYTAGAILSIGHGVPAATRTKK